MTPLAALMTAVETYVSNWSRSIYSNSMKFMIASIT